MVLVSHELAGTFGHTPAFRAVLSIEESPILSYGAGDSTLHVLEQILQ